MGEIKTFQTIERDTRKAAQELYDTLSVSDPELVVFFCSANYDLDVLAEELLRLFCSIRVIGCTTSGEIGPLGYEYNSISGFCLPRDTFHVAIEVIEGVRDVPTKEELNIVGGLFRQMDAKVPIVHFDKCFCFMLIDGLSKHEERIVHFLQQGFDTIPVIGGSAGDDLRLTDTNVYYNGRFHSKAAAVTLIQTSLPFTVFMNQHFIASDTRMVITGADPQKRIVSEINGNPAAEEYAKLVGSSVEALDSNIFSKFPTVVRIANVDFVRSIQKKNPNGSLTFYCAIEEGVVLRIAHGGDLIKSLRELFSSIKKTIGKPTFTLGCECVLRKMEIANRGLNTAVEALYNDNHVVGFNSYGEQFRGIHINQTFTGIAFGKAEGNGDKPRRKSCEDK